MLRILVTVLKGNMLNHKDVYRLINLNKSVYASLLDVVESGPKTLTRYLVTGQHNLMALVFHCETTKWSINVLPLR